MPLSLFVRPLLCLSVAAYNPRLTPSFSSPHRHVHADILRSKAPADPGIGSSIMPRQLLYAPTSFHPVCLCCLTPSA